MNAQFYRKEERDFKQTSQPDRQARREMTLTKRIEEIEARLEQSNQDAFNSDDKWLAFIDHAPTDLALLLSLVKEYRAALEIMEQVAPKYHADGCRCIQEDASDKYCNCGCKTARKALQCGEGMG